jgi:anti-sigma B factor antagonist
VLLIRLAGSLDMYSFPRLESQLNTLFQQGRYSLVLDCRDLDYIGSAGLGALIGFAKQAREHNGDLRLLNVPERIYKIIELLGFTKVLQVHQTEDDAVASFRAK